MVYNLEYGVLEGVCLGPYKKCLKSQNLTCRRVKSAFCCSRLSHPEGGLDEACSAHGRQKRP